MANIKKIKKAGEAADLINRLIEQSDRYIRTAIVAARASKDVLSNTEYTEGILTACLINLSHLTGENPHVPQTTSK